MEKKQAKRGLVWSRVKVLEAALRPFAELPLTDSEGSPVVDLHVKYKSGSGWSMKLASGIDVRRAIRLAAKVMGTYK